FSTVEIRKGKVLDDLKGLEDLQVVERVFRVGLQEQLYIEPQGAIAIPEPDGAIKVIGSLQCPYYVHRALKRALNLTNEQAIVVQAETGGGFGGKEEYPSIVAIHAALLARKAGRPVRLIYDRHEDLAATTKRHPGVIRHRTGVKKDGTLLFQDIEIVLDGGAYCTLTPVVLSRAAIHAAGAYSCPNVRIQARPVTCFPWFRFHRQRREEAPGDNRARSLARRHLPHPHGIHGNRSGYEDDLLSACRGCVGSRVGPGGPCPAGHITRPRFRPHC